MEFDDFIRRWVDFCIEVEDKGLNKFAKGKKFEEIFLSIIKDNVKGNYKVLFQQQVLGFKYRFDFVIVNGEIDKTLPLDPQKVLAVIEVKSHGFYGYKEIDKLKNQIIELKHQNPEIKYMYITYRETNTYDREIREKLGGELIEHYYRLTDSGDGIQLYPDRVFPRAWDRFIKDLRNI